MTLVSLGEAPDILIDKPIVLLGRSSDCDAVVPSKKVSRQHCCIAQINNRLVVVHTTNDYGCAWNRWLNRDYPSALRFGVNLIVFALTQEGSITHQVMDAVR